MITEREKHIWRAALTLAHNILIQDLNVINDEDGSLEAMSALRSSSRRIKNWLNPTDEQLIEMFEEAGVPPFNRQWSDCPSCGSEGDITGGLCGHNANNVEMDVSCLECPKCGEMWAE